jgi:hypothetical protein
MYQLFDHRGDFVNGFFSREEALNQADRICAEHHIEHWRRFWYVVSAI